MAPWIARFVRAAFQQRRHTEYLAPLVRSAADTLESQLSEVGRRDLLRRHGHYALWIGPKASKRGSRPTVTSHRVGNTDQGSASRVASRSGRASEWHSNACARGRCTRRADPVLRASVPHSAHVLDPALVACAFAVASTQAGASILRTSVRHMRPLGNRIEIVTDTESLSVRTAVVCAGAWSARYWDRSECATTRGRTRLSRELPQHAPLTDAPILHADHNVVVTPMASRLRASSYWSRWTRDAPRSSQARATTRQTATVRLSMRHRGPELDGPRPTLPDYLPGIVEHADRTSCSMRWSPTSRTDARSSDRGPDLGPGDRPRTPFRCRSIRSAEIRLASTPPGTAAPPRLRSSPAPRAPRNSLLREFFT